MTVGAASRSTAEMCLVPRESGGVTTMSTRVRLAGDRSVPQLESVSAPDDDCGCQGKRYGPGRGQVAAYIMMPYIEGRRANGNSRRGSSWLADGRPVPQCRRRTCSVAVRTPGRGTNGAELRGSISIEAIARWRPSRHADRRGVRFDFRRPARAGKDRRRRYSIAGKGRSLRRGQAR